jgi:hypothetical protein
MFAISLSSLAGLSFHLGLWFPAMKSLGYFLSPKGLLILLC